MKHSVSTFLIAFFAILSLQAQDGMVFTEGNWESVLQKAKEQDRIIFFDAYTTWCGPCKKLAREVFPDPEVGKFYNANFINVSFDMEKGEGTELAAKYNVQAYPTLLFIDANGKMVHRTAGYMPAPQFVQLGKEAIDPAKNLQGMRTKFEDGYRDPDFLYDYTEKAMMAMDGSQQEIVEAYLGTQADLNSKRNVKYIFDYLDDPDSRAFEFMVQRKDLFVDMFGEAAVGNKIKRAINNKIYYGGTENLSLEEIKGLYEKAYPEKAEEFFAQFKINYYRRAKDIPKFAQAAVDYFNTYPSSNPSELNNIAWTFYEEVEDKALLAEAAKWAEQSVALRGQYYNYDTLAAVYTKLGKTDKAIAAAKKAIEIAKSTGEEYKATEDMLNKLLDARG
ncbi:MAG: thioredoxin fold domain-containing protein [Bacteroidota bacterium]